MRGGRYQKGFTAPDWTALYQPHWPPGCSSSQPSALTSGDFSSFSSPSGMFFPQISSWVAFNRKKEGKKGEEGKGFPKHWGHSPLWVKPAGWKDQGLSLQPLGSGLLLNKWTSSASSQMGMHTHTFPLESLELWL